MAMPSFTRCRYVSDTGLECEKWFQPTDSMNNGQEPRHCELHRGMISERTSPNDESKQRFIDLKNEEIKLCIGMSIEELDTHIAGIEKQIELLRMRTMSARSVRVDKIDKLTDEERKERQKIRVQNPATNDKPKAKTSIKKDPIQHLMDKFGMSREQALKMMEME